MSIRRSHVRQTKKLKRWIIGERRSNLGLTHDRELGRDRSLPPRDRRRAQSETPGGTGGRNRGSEA